MTISIQYLEHRDGRVFEVGSIWPGDEPITDPDKEYLERAVGMIFLLPETSETVEYENEDGSSEEDDDSSDLITKPATYEIWCVNKALHLAWFGGFKVMKGLQIDRAAIVAKMRGTTTMRYVVHADQVVGYYEEWPTVVAYEAMMDRMERSDPGTPQPTNGQPQAQV